MQGMSFLFSKRTMESLLSSMMMMQAAEKEVNERALEQLPEENRVQSRRIAKWLIQLLNFVLRIVASLKANTYQVSKPANASRVLISLQSIKRACKRILKIKHQLQQEGELA